MIVHQRAKWGSSPGCLSYRMKMWNKMLGCLPPDPRIPLSCRDFLRPACHPRGQYPSVSTVRSLIPAGPCHAQPLSQFPRLLTGSYSLCSQTPDLKVSLHQPSTSSNLLTILCRLPLSQDPPHVLPSHRLLHLQRGAGGRWGSDKCPDNSRG